MKSTSINLLVTLVLFLQLSSGFSQNSKNFSTANLNHPKTLTALNNSDTNNLPKITINSLNGYGPYTIGTERSNYIMVYDLPTHTSKITFKILDNEGQIINLPHIAEDNYLESAYWEFESDTMGFSLSPSLQIEVVYQGDSNAIYNIPYVVYADTLFIQSSNGWGPFISNNYTLTNDSWQPAPEISNSFKVKNLPPRTSTIKFKFLSNDSTIIDSSIVNAEEGLYLDSAMYNNVRMDELPLATRYLETAIFCDGGPDNGLLRWNKLIINPQHPKLICNAYEGIFNDSLPNFVQNENSAQILNIDTAKYAIVSNGPGERNVDMYMGPYSLDVLKGSFSIEAWLRLDSTEINSTSYGEFYFVSVDTAFSASIIVQKENNLIGLRLYTGARGFYDLLYEGDFEYSKFQSKDWHHVAITFMESRGKHPKFYIDGQESLEVTIDEDKVLFIEREYPHYQKKLKTNPLRIGDGGIENNFITAIDELRIWNTNISQQLIINNMYKTMLQNDSIVGYWNFDDLRNRQNLVSDLSYNNNRGVLKNGAHFSPQPADVARIKDTLTIFSSHSNADSIIFSFIDKNNGIIFSKSVLSDESTAKLIYDISNQTYKVDHLKINEYYPGCPDTGLITNYKFTIFPPSPIATPKFNWNEIYQSDNNSDILNTNILCSNFPDDINRVILSLEKEGDYYDTVSYIKNSIPYAYSLTLNGTDNYIETSNYTSAPSQGQIEFWFKTSSQLGGKIIGFSETKNGENSNRNEREVIMLKTGVIEFKAGNDITLYANHTYNDGQWHHLKVSYGYPLIELFMDGSIVDSQNSEDLESYSGYWIIGKNSSAKFLQQNNISNYFKATLSEIKIYREGTSTSEIYYKLDDALGTEIKDFSGDNNGSIMGGNPSWNNTSNKLSFVKWEDNLLNKEPGNYDFNAKLFYNGGPEEGVMYNLGRFHIKDPIPNNFFSYSPGMGIGYFNEGMRVENLFTAATDWTGKDYEYYESDFISFVFVTPDHLIIDKQTRTFTSQQEVEFTFDMGDAPQGSYMSVEIGYVTSEGNAVMHSFPLPININKMVPPIIRGDFDGPFEESIAPGTMFQNNTFTIKTQSHLDDIRKIRGVFYTNNKDELGFADAEKINDTIWHLSYDMGSLKPPRSLMTVEYYLGDDINPVIIQGPFSITIHRTRPKWFDFMKDSDFEDIEENGDTITFMVSTYLSKNNEVVENTFTIPRMVPLLGGTDFDSPTPSVKAKLKFKISENKLTLDGPPEFHRELFNFHLGNPGLVKLDFQASQEDFYFLDDKNDLIAKQNFANSDGLTLDIKRIVENPLKELSKLAEGFKASEIIGPTANITISPTLGYASRLNYITDTINGGWGSHGNLKVDTNPNHEEEHNKSASYHFGYMGMNGELSVGATIASGLIDFYVGLSLGLYLGLGYSYVDIPENAKKFLAGAVIQMYWRVYTTVFWDWYEVDLYGPKSLFRWKIGDDMRSAFPPYDKENTNIDIINSDFDITMSQINPVGWYNKIPLPQPNQEINKNDNSLIFSWIDPGNNYGERKLQMREFSILNAEFDSVKTITVNKNLIHNPSTAQVNNEEVIYTWLQTRHDPESIRESDPEYILENLAKSQDIFVAVYDKDVDSIVYISNIDDDMTTLYSGRAETNPHITKLSDNKALITWHVGNLETNKSDLYYSIIEKSSANWSISNPEVFAEPSGIQTNIRIASPYENTAVAIWKNSVNNGKIDNELYTTFYDGMQWSEPESIFALDTSIYYKSYDICFENEKGALVFTTYSNDIITEFEEGLYILPWKNTSSQWSSEPAIKLYSDKQNEINLSKLTISDNENAAIAVKLGKPGLQSAEIKFSQIDLFVSDISNSFENWNHIEANRFVCDTTKQVSDIDITYAGGDTLLILTHEFIMVASNMEYVPTNGARFGNPKMNLVLRSFVLNENGEIENIDEGNLLDIKENISENADIVLEQNFPNPCSYSTNIKFYLPNNTQATFDIYDINGLHIGNILQQSLSAGEYLIDINTSVLKPGIYFYTLTTKYGTKTKKMLVAN